MNNGPTAVLNPSDPGDETQRRFRYQHVKTAHYLLSLFDDTEGVEEVFCEHHEDVLIRYRGGQLRAVQIKTREDGRVPLKAIDDEVTKSITRFIETEKAFPNQIERFILGCNCGFWTEEKNGSNLIHLVEEARACTPTKVAKRVADYLKALCPPPPKPPKATAKAAKSGVAPPPPTPPPGPPPEPHDKVVERALAVLQKLYPERGIPLAAMDELLLKSLVQCSLFSMNHTYGDLRAIADRVIAAVYAASAHRHASPKEQYFEICREPSKAHADSIIQGKRFDRKRAEETLRASACSGLNLSPTPFQIDWMPLGTRKLDAKMTAGGLTIDQVNEAVHQKLAAEYVLSSWLMKHGKREANGRYQDLRSAVLTACNEAKQRVVAAATNATPPPPYGSEMLRLARELIQNLHTQANGSLHGLRYDQLLGIAGVLTEECSIWWSDQFTIPEGVTA